MNIESLSAIAEKNIAGTQALKDFKARQLSLFRHKGMKEITQDSYKFTNLESFFSELRTTEVSTGQHTKIFNDDVPFPTITFLNGAFSDAEVLPSGVTLKKMKDCPEFLDLLKESNPLSALHHSLFGEGVILEVEKNKEISTPIRILNLISEGTLSTPTHMVIADAFSKITVIEETRTEGAEANINETYINAFPGSHVEHIVIQEESSAGLNHASIFAEIAQDASLRSLIFHGSGKMNRTNLHMNLNAAGAHAESYALFLTNGKEHSDIFTEINHKSADTTSNQIAKGILDAESKGVFTGKIHIFPKAQRVASGQLNKNLLLSKKAQVHSQPQLEIFADDVKCSHGSTTGQLSDEEVFYFQSRGIPADKARNLLALGFGLEVVDKITNQLAREHVKEIIMDNLDSKFSLRRFV